VKWKTIAVTRRPGSSAKSLAVFIGRELREWTRIPKKVFAAYERRPDVLRHKAAHRQKRLVQKRMKMKTSGIIDTKARSSGSCDAH